MKRLAFIYGIFAYVSFLANFIYLVGFVENLGVPKSVDSGEAASVGHALLINLALIGLFAVQHSVMARPGFKAVWTRIIPAPIERSTYVLLSSLLLFLLYWKWEPMPVVIWNVENFIARNLIWALCWTGWLIVLASSFMINHFDFLGLRQVWHRMRDTEPAPLTFQKRLLYKFVRHPLMLGFLIAFWATPRMTIGHLLFALGNTAYIFLGVFLEERDLVAEHGESYEQYRREVPKILPLPKRG